MRPNITVLTPDGGEIYRTPFPVEIRVRWSSDELRGDVYIHLYHRGRLYTREVESTWNDGNEIITICERVQRAGKLRDCLVGQSFRIRVGSVPCPGIFDESDTDFTIGSGTNRE